MESTSLINEAHFLERRSEDLGRKCDFDEALQCLVAATDCLQRLLDAKTIANGDIKDSILSQIQTHSRKRQALLIRKEQLETLREIRALQLKEEEERRRAAEERLRATGTAERRESETSGRTPAQRRLGAFQPPQQPQRLKDSAETAEESVLNSHALLSFLDARAAEGKMGEGGRMSSSSDDSNVFSSHVDVASISQRAFKTPKTEADVVEELQLNNLELRNHVHLLLAELEKERRKSSALETSLHALTLSPPLQPSHDVNIEDEDEESHQLTQVAFTKDNEQLKYNLMRLDLPPLDLPKLDVPDFDQD